MVGRFVRYGYTGDVQELARRAEEGVLPLFQALPGFQAYSVTDTDGEIFSLSVWEMQEQAEAASAAAAEWVAGNMGSELELREARYGEILFSSLLGITTTAGITA